MGRTIFCKHYNGLAQSNTCKAGIAYETVNRRDGMKSLPCVMLATENDEKVPCEKCEYPTAEELAERDREFKKQIENMDSARTAIVKHLGGPWKRGTPSAAGVIDCPVCGKAAGLHFSRSGYNGHVHAQCETKGCVAWME